MQLKLHIITIEDLVPQEHLLRKLEATLDLTFVRTETADLYSKRYGRPAIDPVVLVKYLLLGYLYGIPSERQIEVQCRERMPFRWYLGLDIDSPVPDHSTISQNRRRRPKLRKIFRRLFEEVVQQCISAGLMSGRLITSWHKWLFCLHRLSAWRWRLLLRSNIITAYLIHYRHYHFAHKIRKEQIC